MRISEQFESVGHLMSMYKYIKYRVVSSGTIMPRKVDFQVVKRYSNIIKKGSMEDKFIFIGDVEKYIKHYHDNHQDSKYVKIPLDCLYAIWATYYYPDLYKYKTLGHLASSFKNRIKKGEPLPRRLRYRPNLSTIARDLAENSESYFITKGYIKPPGV